MNVPNSTPQFEVAGTIEYIDGHDAGFYFIGYSECRVACKLAFIPLNTTLIEGGGSVVQILLISNCMLSIMHLLPQNTYQKTFAFTT